MTSVIGRGGGETGIGSKIGQNYQWILLKICRHIGGGGGKKSGKIIADIGYGWSPI